MLDAAKGVDFIVHTASPFPIKKPKHENDLIIPAVEGTTAIMQACLLNKVKRVVITSSIAAIMSAKPDSLPKDHIYTEAHWSDPSPGDHIEAYSKSKTMAEKAAWDFQAKHKDEHFIEIATINPSLILGPAFVGAGFSSGDIVTNIILGKYPALPRLHFGLVDVRDCAEAHLQALERPEAANKRFILCEGSYWFSDIGNMLKETWGPQGYTPATKEAPLWLCKCAALLMSEMSHAVKSWNIQKQFVNAQAKSVLGIKFSTPIKKTLDDMVESMISTGALVDKRPRTKV